MSTLAVVALVSAFPTASAWLAAPTADAPPEDATLAMPLVAGEPLAPTLVVWNATPTIAVLHAEREASDENATFQLAPAPDGVRVMRFTPAEGEQDADGHWRYTVAGEHDEAPSWTVVVALHHPEP